MRVRLLVVALLSASSEASADPAFAWSAPDACPASTDVEARIVTRLGVSLDELDHRVAVVVSKDEDAFVALVALDSPSSHEVRTLSADSCGELADAVSVIVARLGHTRVAPPAVRKLRSIARADLDDPPGTPIPEVETEAPAPPAHWSAGIKLAGLGGIGMLPTFAVGGEIAAYVEHGHARLEIGHDSWTTTHGPALTPQTQIDGLLVDFSSNVARFGWRLGDLPVRAQLTGELGTMRGQGTGMLTGSDPPIRWSALGGGFAAEWGPAPWLHVSGGAELDFAIDRARFALVDGTQIYESGQLSARFQVGLELSLP